MKTIIVGAGISGLASYLSLKKHLPESPSSEPHSFTIYEAYDTSKKAPLSSLPAGETHSATLVVGGGLGVSPNGLSVLKRLDEDLFNDVVGSGYPYSHWTFKNSYGWNLARLFAGNNEDPPMNSVAMSRQAVWNCLRDRVPDGVIVNRRISEVVPSAEGRSVVKFADGSPDEEADLVIGADGLKSIVRRGIFREEEEDPYPPHYEGFTGVGGFIPSADLKSDIDPGTMTIVFGGNGFFGYVYSNSTGTLAPYSTSTASPGDTVTWWSTYYCKDCPDTKSIDREAVLRDLRKRHGNWRLPVIQKIINSVELETMWPVWTTPELPTWHRDGLILIGDAAHTLPPTSGQGTSQALEDVESFTLCLSHYLKAKYSESGTEVNGQAIYKQAINQAAQKHMVLRRPRVKKILDRARQMESKKQNMNIFEEFFLYFILYMISFMPKGAPDKNPANYDMAAEVKKALHSDE
ncbi:hypothetical protein FQN54_002804 [Arachnomyces sp. PD_36]|nr:hypothetical protein FQN54_002804 [Arachnomyces sp. PD_36]